MYKRGIIGLLTAACIVSAPSTAQALTINLNDIGGVSGTAAEFGFNVAKTYWESVLTNNVSINIDVGFSSLDEGVLGSTRSSFVSTGIAGVQARIAAFGTSALDAIAAANLTPLKADGSLNVITSAPIADGLGIDTTRQIFDDDGSANNKLIGLTTANAKALGYNIAPGTVDAQISFSSDFGFDFDPRNGVSPSLLDFIGVAVHEIGHALGFVSGVDDYDYLGAPNGPLAGDYEKESFQSDWWGETLDLFRFSDNKNGFGDGSPMLDWSVGTESYFSVDGGATNLARFSTGAFNGNGDQASHWLDNNYYVGTPGCPIAGPSIGIMDPTFAPCQGGVVTALDLAAFDAIGWNTNVDVLANPGYTFSTSQMAAVPEPASWAMMIIGFGAIGGAMRRRPKVTVRYAH